MAKELSKVSLGTKKMTTTTTVSEKKQEVPEDAKIIEQTVRTETEKIENGWLITKHYNGRYIPKDSKDTYGNYFSYDKKWFSEEDPIEITVKDVSLADAFDEET